MAPRLTDQPGQRYGRLVLIEEVDAVKSKRRWRCACDCGSEITAYQTNLRRGLSTSCGCRRTEIIKARMTTHGHAGTPQYNVWNTMIQRCHNENSISYTKYGARGIQVCERWRDSYENFLADMGPTPSGMTIERINGDLGYSPENCRWASYHEQNLNRRDNHNLTYDGQTQCLNEWAKCLNLPRQTIESRLRTGWSVERALSTPKQSKPPN